MSEVVTEGQINIPAATTTEVAAPVTAEIPAATTNAPEVPIVTETAEKKTDAPVSEKPTAVPEKYELKLSEGSLLDQAYLDKMAAEAKAQGLSQDQAQKMVDRETGVVNNFVEARKQLLEQQKELWKGEAAKDKEIGGPFFAQNVERASRNMKQYGTPELEALLNQSGLANHPEMIRAFMRIPGGNGTFVQPNQQGGTAPKSAEEKLYGNKQT